jgi:hypothetical protein
MATHSTSISGATQQSAALRFAGLCALLAGISGLLYSLEFVVLKQALMIPLFLMLGGLFSIVALSAAYSLVKDAGSTIARWAWALSITGALGAAIHGGYDLANAINPPAVAASLANLPSQVDPRGLLTFGFAGLGFFGLAWLMGRSERFPRAMSYLTYLLAALLVILYLGRLIILDPKNPLIAITGTLSGFIVNPLWYIWLGLMLWQPRKAA